MRWGAPNGGGRGVATTVSGGPAVTGKPRELQGFLNYRLYHPLARRLARALATTPVTPNAVSVFGAIMVVSAGLLYAVVASPAAIALGAILHLAWHVVDGADGDLARMTGRASPVGELVDGLCDYGGHTILYVLLAARLDDTMGGAAWGLAVAAGASRIVQSVFAESQRRSYLWWAYGVPWLQKAPPAGRGVGAVLARAYLRLAAWLGAPARRVDALVTAAEAEPTERARVAGLARIAGRRGLVLQTALGANGRTIALALAMMAGHPAWFFLFEATALNLLLVVAMLQQAHSCRELRRAIARAAV